jgi:hypothetical protein
VVGVVGVLFGCAEQHLGRKARGKRMVSAGAAGGDAATAVAALQRQLDAQHAAALQHLDAQHAVAQQQLDALAGQIGLGGAQTAYPLRVGESSGAVAEGGALTVNPLLAAAAAVRGGAPAPRRWRRFEDADDVWFSADDTGEATWEVPEGDVVVA